MKTRGEGKERKNKIVLSWKNGIKKISLTNKTHTENGKSFKGIMTSHSNVNILQNLYLLQMTTNCFLT